jgi:hypothetical protein
VTFAGGTAWFASFWMASSYGGQSRGCIWTLRHPHLIQPYLAYYDHLASHYGGHWCPPIPWWCDWKNLHVPDLSIYIKNGRFTGPYCAQYAESLYKAAPIRFIKFVWGQPAGTKDPKNEVLDNLPEIGG